VAACEVCGGTGFEYVEKDGRTFARPCACRRPAASGRTEDAFVQSCQIPPRYEHCSLANFDAGNASLVAALERVTSYCASYPHLGIDDGLGLLFYGTSGVGKSHLAVAALRELWMAKAVKGRFYDFHELIREIKNSYNEETRTTELQILEPVIDIDVLLLDDLGAWKLTEWMLDTLFYILNGRYMAKKATFITTNFPVGTPSSQDATSRRGEYLVERIGTPLRSRLMEMCTVISMSGPDFRQIRQVARQPFGAASDSLGPDPGPPRPRFGG
jgi:DNA replication protein DnaC